MAQSKRRLQSDSEYVARLEKRSLSNMAELFEMKNGEKYQDPETYPKRSEAERYWHGVLGFLFVWLLVCLLTFGWEWKMIYLRMLNLLCEVTFRGWGVEWLHKTLYLNECYSWWKSGEDLACTVFFKLTFSYRVFNLIIASAGMYYSLLIFFFFFYTCTLERWIQPPQPDMLEKSGRQQQDKADHNSSSAGSFSMWIRT